jgi:tripartite ATP-independent transporter DctP family solute receptor
MRSLIGIIIFVAAGLITAFIVGFRPDLFARNTAYDEEQRGLNERIIIKFSHVVAENTPKGLAAQKFAKLVSEKTNDRVEVQVFPNAILYSDKEEFGALTDGDIQMIAPAFSNISRLFPEWLVFDLPYAFPTQRAVEEAFTGEIGDLLFRTLEQKSMIGLAFWSNGFKQMTNNDRPLLLPDDFAGLKFRIITSKVLESQFRMLGASAVALPFNEVYRNLDSGAVDGQENTVSNIFSKRLYQVQRYMTLSNHGYLGYAVIMNKPFWDRLPQDVRAHIADAMAETSRWMNEHAVSINQSQLREMREVSDIRISHLNEQQKEAWIKALEPIYDEFAPLIGKQLTRTILQLRTKHLEQAD